MMTRAHTLISAFVLVVFGSVLGGCGDDSDQPKYREVSGRVKSVDRSTGVVKMSWFSPKRNEEIELKGKLAPNAEILIDGETARLEDIRIDDRVKVGGRLEKSDDVPQLVATRVEVTRSGAAPVGTSSQPSGASSKPGAEEKK